MSVAVGWVPNTSSRAYPFVHGVSGSVIGGDRFLQTPPLPLGAGNRFHVDYLPVRHLHPHVKTPELEPHGFSVEPIKLIPGRGRRGLHPSDCSSIQAV